MEGLIFILGVAAGVMPASAKCVDPFLAVPVQTSSAFTQTRHFQGVTRPLVSQGQVQIRADQVHWHVQKPVDILTVIAPEGVTQSIDGGPAQALGVQGGDAFLAGSGLREVLAGNFTAARAQFAITSLAAAANGDWRLRLVPRAAQFGRLVRYMDVQGCAGIAQIRVQQANGDWMDIQMAQVNPVD